MYLKRLEIQGFKSFADRTILEFQGGGITAVIGPNGSGKSNISDAIRWCLGEQSMKSLRGSKSEDIIFAGTQARKALSFAEVEMTFDNSDNVLNIEFQEVTIKRKIYRTGESGYFINNVPCRLKDIIELFMDTGIGRDGYSIIGQGRIDEILSAKSEDRRHIFEEAAGIVKYRVRKEESEKKLEQTKLNLIRINDILTEIESTIEPLKEQSDKAKKYLDLRENLKNIEVGLILSKIDSTKQKLIEIQENKVIFEENDKNENNKLLKLQSEKEELKLKYEQIIEEIERIQNISSDSKTKLEKINSDINLSNERILNNNENISRLENSITETTDSIAKLKEEKENKNFKKENLAKNKEHFDKELAEKQVELNKITQTLSSKAKEIEEKKKIIEENTELKYELQQKLNEQEITIKNSNDRIKQLEKDLVSIISNLDRNRIIKNERLLQFKEIENNRNKSIVELSAKQEQINQIELKIKSFDEKINLYQSEKRIKESKVKFLEELEREKEGYAKAVKSIITECEKNHEIKQGYKGVIANIIKVDNRYATAIEMLLGASIQNIVTKAEQDAKTMIEYLRNNNLGRASFLPMTTVKGNKLDRYKSVDGTIGIASDLISYEKEYDGIMQNLLGKAVIVDSMENAIKLAKENRYSFRIATLEGDIITPSGAMTGGSIAKKTSNILGRTEEIKTLKQEVIKLENSIKQLEEQKEEFSKSNAEQIESIEKLKAEIQQNEIIFATEQEKMNSINKEVTSLENEKNKKQQEITNHNKNIETSNNNKNQFLEEIEKIVENSRKLNEEITEYAQKHQADQDKIDILNEDITNLKISVSSFEESNLSIDEIIERITSEIESKTINIESHKKEIIQLKEKNEELSQLIKALEQSILKIKSEVENSQQRQDELKQQRIKENEKISELEKTIEKQFEIIRDIKEQIVKIGMKETNINEAITTLINELWIEYEITPNNAKQFERPTNIKKVEEDVKKLREEIKQLGSINIDSIEEYKRTEERYTQMNEQRYDLETTIAKLHEVIAQMTETMKKRFKEKFEIINKNFNETFKELFGGGMAKVALEDENNILDCGIDIQVQPTGKKLQNMMLLSGGERALTAIALLFAILKINPSPFCILDEIEAALDDVNVYRYADYLKKLNKLTQFLIITHRKGSMEAAGAVYGVTMEENGISKMLSISLKK